LLQEHGYSPDDIDALIEQGVIEDAASAAASELAPVNDG
jgi:hypothetical protein